MSEARKATDVLLDLEAKVDTLINLMKSTDLNQKILSNKLNDVIKTLANVSTNQQPKFVVEAVQKTNPLQQQAPLNTPGASPERNVPIFAEHSIPQVDNPQGNRRISRPDQDDGSSNQQFIKPAEIRVPDKVSNANAKNTVAAAQVKEARPLKNITSGTEIPVSQRCVDKTGKSIFMAEVKVLDLSNGQDIVKTRTNANGKWHAPLLPGTYRITINKAATINKPALEAVQDIQVDGSRQTMELQMAIIK